MNEYDYDPERERRELEMEKLRVDIHESRNRSEKLMMETRWYPIVVVTGVLAALATVLKVLGWFAN